MYRGMKRSGQRHKQADRHTPKQIHTNTQSQTSNTHSDTERRQHKKMMKRQENPKRNQMCPRIGIWEGEGREDEQRQDGDEQTDEETEYRCRIIALSQLHLCTHSSHECTCVDAWVVCAVDRKPSRPPGEKVDRDIFMHANIVGFPLLCRSICAAKGRHFHRNRRRLIDAFDAHNIAVVGGT